MSRLYNELAQYYDFFSPIDRIVTEVEFIYGELGNVIAASPKVLELGCGTGRYLAELAAKGFQPYGIDISRNMLQIARRRVPDAMLIDGDFTDSRVLKRFEPCELVIALSVVLMYVPNIEIIEDIFRSIYERLVPGGLFVFDLWKWYPTTGGSYLGKYNAAETGLTAMRAMEWTPKGALLESRDCFIIDDGHATHVAFDKHQLTLFDVDALTEILSRCGFLVEVRDGFGSDRFKFESKKPVFLCKRDLPG